MEKHFNETELKRIAEGNFPLNELFKKLSHIAQCGNCKTKLKNIDPGFFEDQFETTAELSASEQEAHFSEGEIKAFLKAEISVAERLEMSGHFRNCVICKQKLYEADPSYLKTSIAAYLCEEEEKPPTFSSFYSFVPLCMASLVLACMIGLVIFSSVDQRPANLQAKNLEQSDIKPKLVPAKSLEPDSVSTGEEESRQAFSTRQSRSEAESEKPILPQERAATASKSSSEINKQAIRSAKPALPKAPSKISNSLIVSEVRSSAASKDAKAAAGATGELALSPYFETVTETRPKFRWKAVQNAVKYNFYLSDTSKVLIEEFESASATSYSPKKKLEANKTYKWNVIATLKDGSTLQNRPVLFTVGEKGKREDVAFKNKNKALAAHLEK